jgi:ferredoxin-type protein NapF
MSCVDACDPRALTLDRRGRVTLDPAACTDCGLCLAPCPVDALSRRLG